MKRLGSLLIVAAVLLGAPARAWNEEDFYTDARMIEAGSLLDDREQYPRAIELYRAVIEEFPSNLMARLWMARVLSWLGDYEPALAEYDYLLSLDPPIDNLDVERAEVMSWAGRYDEALTEFDRILDERPDEQRAVVGEARVYSWSGRRGDAAKTYERALRLGDDATIRDELGALRRGLGAGGDAQGVHYFDDDGFERTSVQSSGKVDLGFDTRFVGEMAFSRVGRSDSELLQAVGAPAATDGLSGLVGIERDMSPEVVVAAQIGYAWWASAPGRVLARGRVEATLPTTTSVGLQIDYGSFLPWSDSYEALYAGLDATHLRASVWQGITEPWGAFGYLETTFVGDGNRRIALGASTDYRPFRELDLTVGLALDYLTYTGRSDLYYDPDTDVGVAALARFDQPLSDWMAVFAETSVGMGYALQDSLGGSGVTYGFSGGLRIKRGGLELTGYGGRSQSQRASVYTAYNFGASLKLDF